MLLWGWGLYLINRVYLRLSGRGGAAERRNWLGSAGTKQPVMLLDVLMTASAVLALIAWLVWFIFFAGSQRALRSRTSFQARANNQD
jgi:hypothetical protein